MITEIKKGDKFVCVSTDKLDGAVVGKIYTSDIDNEIALEPHFRCGMEKNASQDMIDLFNKHFIPYTYEAVYNHYSSIRKNNIPDNTDKNKIGNLLKQMEIMMVRSTKGRCNYISKVDCQGNCASCQCDPDVQHELEKEGLTDKEEDSVIRGMELPPYYNNDNGSLYKIAEQRGWGVRLFDLVKRLERNGKKDPLEQEIRKSIGVLELWLKELK